MTAFREIRRSLRVLEAPPYEPVSRALAKSWCNIDADLTDQDSIIDLLIAAARERAEDITGRAFVQRSLELVMDDLPDGDGIIELPAAPLISVSYVRYLDASGEEQELSGSPDAFLVDTRGVPGRISPLQGTSWPGTNGTPSNVRIGYVAGYAPAGSPDDEEAYQLPMPALLRTWMHARISTFYEMREQLMAGANLNELPRDYVDGLLDGLTVRYGLA